MDNRILIVTGAGASRKLGREKDMPLMGDWSGLLEDEINRAVGNGAGVVGIRSGLGGEEFEQNLGRFLDWIRTFTLLDRYRQLGNPNTGENYGYTEEWWQRTRERATAIQEALRKSLWDNFSSSAIDSEKATTAFAALDSALGGKEVIKIIATTNYDPAAEIAFKNLGYTVRDGIFRPIYETARLQVAGIGNWAVLNPDAVVVMHLHGGVGWYSREGQVVFETPVPPYNPTLGVPAILPPDPNKDPVNDPIVSDLWQEFRAAVSDATKVLVLGHSLHDAKLVEELAQRRATTPLAIAGLKVNVPQPLEGAEVFELEFGPKMKLPGDLVNWLKARAA